MTRRDHFDEFLDHTLVKHFLLDSYVKAWASILLRGRFREIWFVDAFAGAGQDSKGNPGSPLIAARIAQQVNTQYFPQGIGRHAGMHVAAFEWDHDRFRSLKQVMAPFTSPRWPDCIALVREGALEDKLEQVVAALGSAPALYFLDPFGVDGLSATALPRILAGPHNELLVLFADEGAVRLAGKARAGNQDEAATLASAVDQAGESLFGEQDTEHLRAEARAAAKRSLAGHKSNERGAEILDRALGDNSWQPIIDDTPDNRRQAKFVELYMELLLRSGARYVLPFAVDTTDGRHKYFLIHASRERSARHAMKDAMHRTLSNRAASEEVLLQDCRITTDINAVVVEIAAHFAGRQSVRWAPSDHPGTIQRFAFDETPLWFHERDALKAALLQGGFTDLNDKGKPKSPLAFTFPARTPRS